MDRKYFPPFVANPKLISFFRVQVEPNENVVQDFGRTYEAAAEEEAENAAQRRWNTNWKIR